MQPLLEIRDLTKRFGGLLAVDRVSFSVGAGEIVGLIGPNGAGKTTVFNLLTGVYPVTAGTIECGGHAIANLSPHEIAQAGLARTFQNIRLFKQMSIFDNVRVAHHCRMQAGIWGALSRNHRTRVEEKRVAEHSLDLLAAVGLADRQEEPAMNLSYGMQRKLEIVRALASEPKLLLLDEPAAGMNPSESNELLQLILQLNQQGLTILLIEHNMKLLMDVARRVIVLDYGKKIAEGSPEEIQNNPRVIEAYLGRGAAACSN